MRKKPYPWRLEPEMRKAILDLGLMSKKELEDARGQIKVRGVGGFRWPDFLALGPGAFIGAWNPPDLTGLAGWIKKRAHRYGVQLDVKVRQDHNGSGSVEFSTGLFSARREWRRSGHVYAAIKTAFDKISEAAGLALSLIRLEPQGDRFEWVLIRARHRKRFDDHLRGERDWHMAVSRAGQRLREAREANDREAQMEAARVGVIAGERMRVLGGDVSHHTRDVAEMYELLGNRRAAARWRRYHYRDVPYGMMR